MTQSASVARMKPWRASLRAMASCGAVSPRATAAPDCAHSASKTRDRPIRATCARTPRTTSARGSSSRPCRPGPRSARTAWAPKGGNARSRRLEVWSKCRYSPHATSPRSRANGASEQQVTDERCRIIAGPQWSARPFCKRFVGRQFDLGPAEVRTRAGGRHWQLCGSVSGRGLRR
jgi:hypothetical protein